MLLVGIGLTWLTNVVLGALVRGRNSRSSELTSAESQSKVNFGTKIAIAVGASLVVLTVLPATFAQQSFRLPTIAGIGCPDGQKEVVARVGRESMAIAIGPPRNPVNEPLLGIQVGQVEADPARRGAWWANDLPELQKDTVLLYAIQLMPDVREQLVPLIFDGPLPSSADAALSFCYDPKPTSIGLGGSILYRAFSVKAVPLSNSR